MPMLVNLLPDSKLERIRAQKLKQRSLYLGGLAAVIIAAVPLIMLGVVGSQALLIGNAQRSIDDSVATLQDQENLPEVLTVQSQLDSLSGLYRQRTILSEFLIELPGLLTAEMQLTRLYYGVDGSFTVSGLAGSNRDVRTFVTALESYDYATGEMVDHNEYLARPDTPLFLDVTLENLVSDTDGTVVFNIVGTINQEFFYGRE